MSGKKKLVILFGGKSTEHEVSRRSAYSVIKNTDNEKFETTLVGITKSGDWAPYTGSIDKIPDGSWENEIEKGHGISNGIEVLKKADIVFPVLHGFNGEDGTVQGLLELMELPYVGCNILASAVCMDKVYTKIVLDKADILQSRHITVHRHIFEQNPQVYADEIAAEIGYPCFIKPANSGSSVGVYKVSEASELFENLKKSLAYDRKVIVEEFIKGREIECAVLGNLEPKAAIPGEIIPSKEFYDYEDKYLTGESVSVIPANIPEEALAAVRETACKAFKALDCSGLARIDFFYNDETKKIILNEVNTLPGFTEISMYAKMWANMGLSFKDLITELAELALLRQKENERSLA